MNALTPKMPWNEWKCRRANSDYASGGTYIRRRNRQKKGGGDFVLDLEPFFTTDTTAASERLK